MTTYEKTLTELKRSIEANKNIHKFYSMFNNLTLNTQHEYFNICRRYLENEYNNKADQLHSL
jgi:hypothetical protein